MDYPRLSPWGEVERCDILAPGVYEVSTPSHGGIMVAAASAAAILSSEALQRGVTDGDFICYEEDCAAPIVIRELIDQGLLGPVINGQFVAEEYERHINESLQHWHKDYWMSRAERLSEQMELEI